MPDKYPDFAVLCQHEHAGEDYRILIRLAKPNVAIVAPHGGGIEPGTSELACAIAGSEFSYYAFEGLKTKGNADLHITSTRFDEPLCINLVARSDVVLAVHGENRNENIEAVFVGGRDMTLGRRLWGALKSRGFAVARHADPKLQGLDPANLCNRGTKGEGVQLEISRGLRKRMFASLSACGRKHTTVEFRAFVSALRLVLNNSPM